METIGSRLRQEREAQGIDRKAFAKATGIGYSTIAELERGGMQTSTKLRVIAEALGVSLGWLETGKGPKRLEAVPDLPAEIVAPAETPAGYVRFDLYEGAAGMGLGIANNDYPEVIRTLDVAEWEIRKKLGFLPAPGRMRLITGRGPSMRPKIEDGDVVMIDTTVTYFDGDDYYLISVDGEAQIKMLQKRVDGIYVVSSNPDFREWKIASEDLVVCGKALIGMGLRRL